MAGFLEIVVEIAGEVLAGTLGRRRGWTGILVVGFVALVICAIVWIAFG